ncbi:MAG: TonB-dependent receptor plug domain-containing protein [Cyclobacteriaceae bacterium]
MRTFLFSIFLFGSLCAISQGLIPLPDHLIKVEEKYQVKFSYDPEILANISITEENLQNLESFLSFLSNTYPLSIQKVSEKYYTISLTQSTYLLSLSDSITAEPLPTELYVFAVNGKLIKSTTNKGAVEVQYTPHPDDKVEVMVYGFDSKEVGFNELINSRKIIKALSPEIVRLQDILIEDYLTKGINLNPTNQTISIKTADLPLLPGETDGDIFASLAALPGISYPDNRPGNLFIRGSSRDQSLIVLNDIPIYHNGHYFGTISPYNPMLIDKVEVYRNGFQPNIGGRVGGAIALTTQDKPLEESQFGIGTNTLYGHGYAKVVSKDKKLSTSIGARRSYPYSFDSPKLRAISDMVFQTTILENQLANVGGNLDVVFEDYLSTSHYEINSRNKLSLTGLYSRSSIAYGLDTLKESNQHDNLAGNLKWTSRLTDKFSSETSLTVSKFESLFLQEAIDSISRESQASNRINDIGFIQEFTNKLGKNLLTSGVEVHHQSVSFATRTRGVLLGNRVPAEAQVTSITASPYINMAINQFEDWEIQSGLRVNYYSHLNDWRIAPRLFVNYYGIDNTIIKGTLGQYNQYLSQVKTLEFGNGGFDNDLWVLADQDTARVLEGLQTMLGGVYSKNGLTIDLEGYYKTAKNVSYYSAGNFNSRGFFLFGKHQMYGADLLIKKQATKNLSLWGGYSLAFSKVVLDSAKDISYDSQYSQPHIFKIGAAWAHRNLKVSAGWSLMSGQKVKTFRIIASEKNFQRFLADRANGEHGNPPPNGGRPRPSIENPFESLPYRYDPLHTLDVSASYTLPKTDHRGFKTVIGISIMNLYNQQNQIDKVVRANLPVADLLDRYAMSFAPNLMVTLEW